MISRIMAVIINTEMDLFYVVVYKASNSEGQTAECL